MNAKTIKGYKGKGMDGFIARRYDQNARKYIIDQYKIWAFELKKIIPQKAKVLEIAPGPGYLSIELAKLGINYIIGMDISKTFVNICTKNASDAKVNIQFLQGNASEMIFEDESFTHIICTSSFKNFSEPLKALNEMHRVLKPGGIAWICDMRREVTNAEIKSYTKNMMQLRGFNSWATNITFKYMLRKRAYTKNNILSMVSNTKFRIHQLDEKTMEYYLVLKKENSK